MSVLSILARVLVVYTKYIKKKELYLNLVFRILSILYIRVEVYYNA
jgi:hypothetical protein